MAFRVRYAPLALALTAALAAPAHADDATDLDRVVVVASRTPQSISEIPGTVWVIDQAELEQQFRAGVPFKEALAQLIPGLDIGPQGRTNYGQNLRGRSVLVMIDGVSLNSSRGVSRQFDSIDPFNIARIEVVSGANAMYGGGATGGIINIVTKRGQSGLQLETALGVRSGLEHSDDHDWRAAQSIAGGNDRVQGRLAAAFQDNSAAYDANGEQVLPDITQTDLQYNRSLDLMGSLDFSFDGGQSLRLMAQHYDSGYNGDEALYLGPFLQGALGRPPVPELIEVREGFESDVEPESRRWMFNADFHAPDVLGGQDLYLQAFTRDEALYFYPFPGTASGGGVAVPYYSTSRQKTELSGIKLALARQWDGFTLTYGVDYDHETFVGTQALFDTTTAFASGGLVFDQTGELGRYPEFENDGTAGFVQAQWQVADALSLNAGWRHQRADVTVADFVPVHQQVLIFHGVGSSADPVPGGSNDYSVDLFNAGAVWALGERSQLWGNYSEGFELPDPPKYYGRGSYELGADGHWTLLDGVSVAESPLAGIKTRQVELGWRHAGETFDVQAAAFHAWSDRDIVVLPDLSIDEVERKTRNTGLEAQLRWRPAPGWELGGNLLAIRTEVEENGDWQRAAATAASPSKLGLFGGWQGDAFGLRLQAMRTFDMEDGSGRELQGYTTVDLLGDWQLPVGRLAFGIQNLFNEDYMTIWGQRAQMFYGALAAPRTFEFRGRGRTYGLTWSVQY